MGGYDDGWVGLSGFVLILGNPPPPCGARCPLFRADTWVGKLLFYWISYVHLSACGRLLLVHEKRILLPSASPPRRECTPSNAHPK